MIFTRNRCHYHFTLVNKGKRCLERSLMVYLFIICLILCSRKQKTWHLIILHQAFCYIVACGSCFWGALPIRLVPEWSADFCRHLLVLNKTSFLEELKAGTQAVRMKDAYALCAIDSLSLIFLKMCPCSEGFD